MVMKTQKETEKGCGKQFYCKEFSDVAKCGVDLRDLRDGLCPTCKALLRQSKEFIEIIDERIAYWTKKTQLWINRLKKDYKN